MALPSPVEMREKLAGDLPDPTATQMVALLAIQPGEVGLVPFRGGQYAALDLARVVRWCEGREDYWPRNAQPDGLPVRRLAE